MLKFFFEFIRLVLSKCQKHVCEVKKLIDEGPSSRKRDLRLRLIYKDPCGERSFYSLFAQFRPSSPTDGSEFFYFKKFFFCLCQYYTVFGLAKPCDFVIKRVIKQTQSRVSYNKSLINHRMKISFIIINVITLTLHKP